ncbi:Acyl-lipid omega-3 desaturase [Podila verticillata]|uniref:Fatty acid desaturase domain-containing protein n=1 Tax=Podila verticillata NRRL 6337 TaxID=1069443 RepID=A0A086TMA8_9FUNG|nr:Acyl-lipid omega-3 desaturase [Podila verticillata]KFH63085.1 hypothetical protein MVEG_11122 [Podila verticillata NRRL 6337]
MTPPLIINDQVSRRFAAEGKNSPKSNFEHGYVPMDFTVKELRDSIPAHLFLRNTTTSLMYVAKDLFTVATVFYSATFIDTLPSSALKIPAWIAYWIIQGTVMTGLWVIGHECVHGNLSDIKIINTIIGWVFHSSVFVPYQAWQISHSHHHKGIGNMTKDVVFVPPTRSDLGLSSAEKAQKETTEEHDNHHDESPFAESPIYTLWSLSIALLLGWPLYLLTNASGQRTPHWVNHFQTVAPYFEPHHAKSIFYSNCGIALMVSILTFFSTLHSPLTVVKYYGIPYLIVNAWTVCITYLQHTDPKIPRFRGRTWNFQRGAACTIDRSYGRILNHLHHHTADTHLCHHMFSQIPFYNAVEATKHLKAKLGEYYVVDDTPIAKALYRNWRECKFVEDEGEVAFFKH